MTDYQYENGYGASVIPDRFDGGAGDRFEVAVTKRPDRPPIHPWPITYETPITGNVLTWLTRAEVEGVLARIEALTPVDIAAETIRRKRVELEHLRGQAVYLEAVIAELEAADYAPNESFLR